MSTLYFVTFVTHTNYPQPTNDHQNTHTGTITPNQIGATHSPRTLSPPVTLATVAGLMSFGIGQVSNRDLVGVQGRRVDDR